MITDPKTLGSTITAAGLALLGSTCCALPIALVALGMGGVVASLISAMPWLTELSEYKSITFTLTGLLLAYSWWRVRRVSQCDVSEGKRLRIQRIVLWTATFVFVVSVLSAYALYPFTIWLDGLSLSE